MNYRDMKFPEILEWCKANGQDKIDWLKEISATPIQCKDENGKPVFDEAGNPVMRDITYVELKIAFVNKFMPEIAPKKKPKMKDIIKSL